MTTPNLRKSLVDFYVVKIYELVNWKRDILSRFQFTSS